MAGNVIVVFTSEQRGSASDALRALGFTSTQGGGYIFDSVEYSKNHTLATLTHGYFTYHVPVSNILLVRVATEGV